MASETNKNKEKKRFFKDFKAELKKVIWPTPKQIVNNTIAVITIVIVTAIIVFILDLAFEAINKYGINRLRSLVPEKETIVEEVENHEEEDNSEETKTTENTVVNTEESNNTDNSEE